jgi:hypothetical protein
MEYRWKQKIVRGDLKMSMKTTWWLLGEKPWDSILCGNNTNATNVPNTFPLMSKVSIMILSIPY